jgi:2-dehydro-3-deoxygluconokinase
MNFDLVALGEPLLRLSPPKYTQLRRAASLDAFVVGSQLNVAANLARLGKRTALVTRLPDNPLGLLALDAIRSYGVDTSHVKLVSGGKLGVTYVEFSQAPRAPLAIYDRAGSAAGTTSIDDFDWNAVVAGAAIAYTDGIFPGLGEGCLEATAAFIGAARQGGCRTAFDVNYREHLWTPQAAREAWSLLLPQIDIIVTNRGVSETVFGFQGDDEAILRQYRDRFGCRIVCLTHRETLGLARGAWTSCALTPQGIVQARRREFDIVDRYGTGDAWLAGFLYGHLARPGDLYFALDFAGALCALAHTIEGDVAHVTPAEVLAIMEGGTDLQLRR